MMKKRKPFRMQMWVWRSQGGTFWFFRQRAKPRFTKSGWPYERERRKGTTTTACGARAGPLLAGLNMKPSDGPVLLTVTRAP